MPTLAAAVLAVSAALASAGCCCCAPACGGPPHGVFAHDSCDPPCTDDCVSPVDGCARRHGSRGLFGFLKESACCTSGCGELYLHPWINDPPHPCDPCDDCGHWTGAKHFCGPAGCGAACNVSWRGLWGQRSDLAHGGSPAMHVGHYDGEIIEGPVLHSPTPAEPLLSPGEEELEEEDIPPAPPARPARSALKKVDGQPAAYYNRPHRR
jgi:hypothetical protein